MMNKYRGLWRGKRKDNGEWVEGYYVCLTDGKNDEHRIYTGYADTDCGNYYPDYYIIDPSNLGECTTQPDMHGNTIFEGDILRCVSEGCDNTYITSVWAEGNTLCVDVAGQDYDIASIDLANELWRNDGYEIEIIGNIHDNPQLLQAATGEDIGNAAQDTLPPT